jgi:hypothetical protein
MPLTLSFPELSAAEINKEIGPLSDSLQFEGVPAPERKHERDDALDAGTLLMIAIPVAIPIARGIGKFLATRFGTKVRVSGPKGVVEITNAESKDMAAIASKISGIM